jgi:hypothetical protein
VHAYDHDMQSYSIQKLIASHHENDDIGALHASIAA